MDIKENLTVEGFPQRLEKLLSDNNTIPADLAKSTGLTNATIYKLCNRNNLWGEGKITVPSSENLLKISAFFKVSPYWLLFGKTLEFESEIKNKEIKNKDSEIENLKKENEQLKQKNEAYKRIFNSSSRKITDLFEDFQFLQKEMNLVDDSK